MQVGILQQLRSSTFAGSSRWCTLGSWGEDLSQRFTLTSCVQHLILLEKPLLQSSGTMFAFLLESSDLRFVGRQRLSSLCYLSLPPSF